MSRAFFVMHKQDYLTAENASQKRLEWREAVEQVRRQGDFGLNPSKTALLVLDMQRYFLEPESHAFVPSAPFVRENITALAKACNQAGVPVISTRHINTLEDAGNMATWWREIISQDHPLAGSALPDDDIIFDREVVKSRYDIFFSTGLECYFKYNKKITLLISGVMTHLCCETTARSAFMRGFDVVFLADGTATYSEELHVGSLRGLAHGFARIGFVDDVIAALQAKP